MGQAHGARPLGNRPESPENLAACAKRIPPLLFHRAPLGNLQYLFQLFLIQANMFLLGSVSLLGPKPAQVSLPSEPNSNTRQLTVGKHSIALSRISFAVYKPRLSTSSQVSCNQFHQLNLPSTHCLNSVSCSTVV